MTDLVVIGAGIAGLHAASLLIAEGLDVVVLEARDRVGGRLASHVAADGAALDLGATWFWPGERRVAGLATQLGVATHPHHLAGDAMFEVEAGLQRLDGNPIDVMSSRFSDGAESLATALAAALPDGAVVTGARATRIATGADEVRVVTEHRTWQARHVVIALPPALAVQRVAFDPPLPEDLAQVATRAGVWMGAIAKVVVRYATPFWRGRGLSGSAVSHVGPMRELHDLSGPDGAPAAIFGFAPGQAAGPALTREAILAQLVRLFGPEAADPLDLTWRDWSAEEFTSPDGVERLTEHQLFGHPLLRAAFGGGALRFASTETAAVSPGHIEGALEAAEHAAQGIMHHRA